MIKEIDELLIEWANYYRGGYPSLNSNYEIVENLDKSHDLEPSEAAAWMETVICKLPERDRRLVCAFYLPRYAFRHTESIARSCGLSRSQMYARIDRIHRYISDVLYKIHSND